MRTAQKILLVLGAAALAVLVWSLDPSEVWAQLAKIGWGMPVIFAQEIVAHAFNALGWRLSCAPKAAAAFRFSDLLRLRIVGDGVNYLTPSAQIAGEFARASLLDPRVPLDARVSGIAVAKLAQAAGQGLVGLCGAAYFLEGRIAGAEPYLPALRVLFAAALAGMAGMVAYEALRGKRHSRSAAMGDGLLRSVPRQAAGTLRDHPGRFALAVASFAGAFVWGTFEVWYICRLLGLPVGWTAAFAIEALSCVVDGLFFFVPAKMGSQEAGKTAIFHALGLPASAGLAFGIVRHVRELAWAGLGLALYSRSDAVGAARGAPARESAAL